MSPKNNSRTTNTLYNFTSSIGGQLISTIMKFAIRTVFISSLGKTYLGIGGLFANILSMLSLAELGVGSAIIFKLYDPLANKDEHRIALLMHFYRTVYRVIGIVICILGVCVIPMLPYLINDYDQLSILNINAVLVFLLYLLQSVSSYLFFAYKSAIIKADQKEYLLNVIEYFFTVIFGIIQIFALILFKNFELYIAINIATTISKNIVYAKLSDKMYPFINAKIGDRLSKNEVIKTFKDCGALMIYKLNFTVVKATDNIVLSAFRGLSEVAMYANYYIFYVTINNIMMKIFNSVAHSLGSLHTTHDSEHEYEVFESIFLICAILGGTAGVGIAVVSDEFVKTWIGADWVLAKPFAILMGIECFSIPYKKALSKYRTIMGLFQQAKFRPLAGMIINLVVSIALVNICGICGVLAGTIVADWTTMMWYDPIIIHKYGFNDKFKIKRYYIKLICNLITVAFVSIVDILICRFVFVGFGWGSVIVHAIICGVTVPSALILVNFRRSEGQYIIKLLKGYANKITEKVRIHE